MKWTSFLWQDVSRRVSSKELGRVDFLKSNRFFSKFSSRQIQLTAEFLHQRDYAPDEHVFEIGHPGAALYFIERGQIAIEVPKDDGSVALLATLEGGAFFGEMALLHDDPRSANARAVNEVRVLALPRAELLRMVEQSPEVAIQVYRSLAEITSDRLKATIERIKAEEKKQRQEFKAVANG